MQFTDRPICTLHYLNVSGFLNVALLTLYFFNKINDQAMTVVEKRFKKLNISWGYIAQLFINVSGFFLCCVFNAVT